MPFRALKLGYLLLNDEKAYVSCSTHEACIAIPQMIPRSPGHNQEWVDMIKGGAPAYSNFEISAYLTAIIQVGCIAQQLGEGRPMDWDGPNMKSTNLAEAAQFVKRNYRSGWEP